jgi:hypothetical protein
LRTQVKAALIFNGHTHDTINAIDEDTFTTITIMYADGVLGNQGLLNNIGALTNGIFNYLRPPNTAPYSLKSILGSVYGYLYPDVEASPSDSLKVFMSQAKGFKMDRFSKG